MLSFDCVLFDIDGVLVDIRKSYNAAIKKTVEYMLKSITDRRSFRGLVTDQIILKFRQSGGFNNDTDTTYAITLAMLASQPKSVAEGRKFLMKVAGNADEGGYVSVEKFLANYDIEKWKKLLNYPAPVKDSMLARVFDELFYGPELFRKQNSLEPKYWAGGKPFIKNDRIDVSIKTMKKLHEMFRGNLAIVSGRSRLAAEYSLRPVMKYFNLDACVFLEDEKREYAKPNPYAIKRAMKVMNAKTAIYAGDSAEDLLMARRAEKEAGVKIAFVGIYGNSPNPARTVAQFRQEGVEAVAKSVSQLIRIINAIGKA
ncbi:HAD family hydrolase [Candidatus Nitrososphaera gargensis]|uniref:HAD family hydrolase n=1 Tax=Candidatus Nitrososphaera gargensis TaxID=497727 RepID=UPI0011E51B73|nr:HAD family hydrolase [Candidatus Nitrososphaera gargensis]